MTPDANLIGQETRRREQFARWLVKAWDWADDTKRHRLAAEIEEMLQHVAEADYPLWDLAAQFGLTGDTKVARILARSLGTPLSGPKMSAWEREINFSPVITLAEGVFDSIYSSMGWANRTVDTNNHEPNFYLWSPTGNIVRFIRRAKVAINAEDDD